ncbi:hypothetical protein, partial [Enterobacter hormaechei]
NGTVPPPPPPHRGNFWVVHKHKHNTPFITNKKKQILSQKKTNKNPILINLCPVYYKKNTLPPPTLRGL